MEAEIEREYSREQQFCRWVNDESNDSGSEYMIRTTILVKG
jgi:hypothetical protein